MLALLLRPHAATQSETVVTPAAHRQTLALVDGSRVELDARTQLRVAIGNGRRLVQLTSGEAFFTVAHDPSHPFVVETPAGTAQVTGTKFDVRVDSQSRLRVTVVNGTVLVRPTAAGGGSGATLPLTAGDQLSAGPDGIDVHLLSAASLDDTLAWRQGQVVFHDTPLREAIGAFARYHDQTVMVTPAAGQLRLGGRYSLDDLQGFLSALEQIEPVRINRRPDGTVQVSLRSGP